MKQNTAITCLFLDIGGVLLNNGWDHHARQRAAETFKLGWDEMEVRHRLNFAIHEEGKLTLAEYLRRFADRPSYLTFLLNVMAAFGVFSPASSYVFSILFHKINQLPPHSIRSIPLAR